MVAEGKADVYPRFAPTMEWDTAAGHAIARAAGMEVYQACLLYTSSDAETGFYIVKFMRELRSGNVDAFMERLKVFFAGMPYEPVSYTHLDVYKRQLLIKDMGKKN